jgi:four helix bundle protein
MAFKFEGLQVWQQSLILCNEVDLLTQKFPKNELFSLGSQMKRAADSVNLNIAEGCVGQSKAEYSRFLTYSVRSGFEVVSCLFIAHKRKYISDCEFNKLYNGYEILCKMISRLKLSL